MSIGDVIEALLAHDVVTFSLPTVPSGECQDWARRLLDEDVLLLGEPA